MKFGLNSRSLTPVRYSGVLVGVLLLVLNVEAKAQAPVEKAVASPTDVEAGPSNVEEKGDLPSATTTRKSPPARLRLGDRAELDRIIELYMAGNYERCSSELSTLLDDTSGDAFEDRTVREQGRMYFASCALLEGRREDALQALRLALEEDPLMSSPDSLTFPPPVVSLFLEVRDEVQQLIADREKEQVIELRRENEKARREVERRVYREQQLEKLARQESVVVKNTRFVASLPFGVGQFQNDDRTLGTVVLVTEALLLGTAITSALILEDLTSKAAASGGNVADVSRHNSQTAAAHSAMTWSTWAFLGAGVLGIVEAHLNFVEEHRLPTRERPLPKDLELDGNVERTSVDSRTKIYPTFGVGPEGGHLGFVGTF